MIADCGPTRRFGSRAMEPCCSPWKLSSGGSSNGYYAHELADVLHAEVQEPLRHLLLQGRLSRTEIDGQFLYTRNRSDRSSQTNLGSPQRSSSAFGGSFGGPRRSPPMNSRPRLSWSTDCSTNSNAACLLAWSPSAWVMVATPCSAISSV